MPLFFVIFTGVLFLGLTAASAITSIPYIHNISVGASIIFSITLAVFAFIKKPSSRAFVPCLSASAAILFYIIALFVSRFDGPIMEFSLIYMLLIVPAVSFISWAISLIVGLMMEISKKH